MMKKMINRAVVLTAVVSVSGCSLFGEGGYFRDRDDDYLKADVIAPMKLPEGVSDQKVAELYVVPSITSDKQLPSEFQVPRPQPLADNGLTDKVKIQKLGDERWILVSAPPSQVWPLASGFLSKYNLNVVYTNPAEGIIETGWLTYKDATDVKDKYRLQIEPGVQPDTTEIHVLHMNVNAAVPGRGQVNWPAKSINPERESWMVDELAASIASQNSRETASLLAQQIAGGNKVELANKDGEPVLEMKLTRNRAWATLSHAVTEGGFSLWESDEAVGVLYVDYKPLLEEADEPGFFGRMFGGDKKDDQAESSTAGDGEEGNQGGGFLNRLLVWGKSGDDSVEQEPSALPKKPISQSPYRLSTVLQHLQLNSDDSDIFNDMSNSASEPLDNVPGYLIIVRGYNDEVDVRIRDGYGQRLSETEADQLLTILRANLI